MHQSWFESVKLPRVLLTYVKESLVMCGTGVVMIAASC
jgi:hypothetical protein